MIFLAAKQPDKKNDYITNKVLAVFTVCLVGVLFLMFLNNMLSSTKAMMGIRILNGGKWVGAILAFLGAVLIWRENKQKADVANKLLRGRTIALFGIVLFLMFQFLYRYADSAFKALYVALPAFAFLYLIYHSYQREFFVLSMDCAAGAAGAYLVNTLAFGGWMGYVLLAAALIFAIDQTMMVSRIQKGEGKFRFRGKDYAFKFSKNAYTMMYLGSAVLALVPTLGFVTGNVLLAAGLAAVLFIVSGVYYTVKLV